MTAPYASFKAETKVLVENGVNRMEDALACEAARMLLLEAGSVPPAAFGSIPKFSAEMYAQWTEQFAARAAELESIRDALWAAGSGLLRVAADYENTDIEVAYLIGNSWSVRDNVVGSYLDTLFSMYGGLTYPADGTFPSDFRNLQNTVAASGGGDGFDFGSPIETPVLPTYTQETVLESIPFEVEAAWPWEDEWMWPWESEYYEAMGKTSVDVPKVSIAADPGAEDDKLVAFVMEDTQGNALALGEAIIEFEDGSTGGRPMQDMIVPAWTASAKVFESRQSPVQAVSAAIAEIAERVTNQSGRLNAYWEGVGAASYLSKDQSGLAPLMGAYLLGLSARIDWLTTRGSKIGGTIQAIRSLFAEGALKQVEAVNAANDEYRKAVASVLGGDPASSVKTAIEAVFSIYTATRKMDAELVKAEIDTEKGVIASKLGVGLGELYLEPRRFQTPGGGAGWSEPGLWKNKGGALPGYSTEQEIGP